MSGEGNIGSQKSLLMFSNSGGASNRAMVGGTVSGAAQDTTIDTGLASIDLCGVSMAEDMSANVDGLSIVISGVNVVVGQFNDGAAASTGFLDFHWWAIGPLPSGN